MTTTTATCKHCLEQITFCDCGADPGPHWVSGSVALSTRWCEMSPAKSPAPRLHEPVVSDPAHITPIDLRAAYDALRLDPALADDTVRIEICPKYVKVERLHRDESGQKETVTIPVVNEALTSP